MTREAEQQSVGPRIGITGIGLVSPAGLGAAACFEALRERRELLVDLARPWARPPFQLGAPCRDFDAREWVSPRRLRRLNRISQLALIAATQALREARLEGATETGVVLGTGLGALAETVEFMRQLQSPEPALANPALFPATVMNVAASQVSIELGLQGYNTTVNHKETSAEQALLVAHDALRLGRAGAILWGGVDELTEPVHHGYRRMGALTRTRPRPYGGDRDGLALGEGAAVLVLEPIDRAAARGVPVLAEVAGVAVASGVRPLVGWGPAPEMGRTSGPALEAATAALEQALARSGIGPEEIDLVVGCACGSPDRDRIEAQALAQVFGRDVPLTTPHGALGCYMADGALRAVTAVEALRRGEVYPAASEGPLDPDLSVGGLVAEARRAAVRAVLVSGHATGGASAAFVLRRGEA